MPFDFKKEYKEFYMPKNKPEIVNIPEANYIAVRSKGDPNEPGTVEIMNRYIDGNGYENDFSDTRIHHEIYLSDARKVPSEKWKTVIRSERRNSL